MTMTVMIIIMITIRMPFSPTFTFFSFLFFIIFFSTLLFSNLLYSFHFCSALLSYNQILSTLLYSILFFSLHLYSAFFCTGYFLSGTNEHEGNVFVFSAFSSRMSKIFYQTCVFGFFHASAPSVLKKRSEERRVGKEC